MKQLGIPVTQSSVPVAFRSGWDQVTFLLGGSIAIRLLARALQLWLPPTPVEA